MRRAAVSSTPVGEGAGSRAPPLVLLHEGLGCVSMWRDWPRELARATGREVFAYSRFGYGGSSPAGLPWPLDFMTREARAVLPRVLEAAGIGESPVLVGHSDGGTIALLCAASGEVPLAGVVTPGRPCVQRAALHRGDRGGAGGVPARGAARAARQTPRRSDRRCLPGMVRRLARSGIRALEHRGGARGGDGAVARGAGARGRLRDAAPGRGHRRPNHRPLPDPWSWTIAAILRTGTGGGRRPPRSPGSSKSCNLRPVMRTLCLFHLHAMMSYVRISLAWRVRRHRTGEKAGGVVRSNCGARERTMAITDPPLEMSA